MRQTEKTAILVSLGCWGYPMLEYLWRGWSHWSMALAGGVCFGLVGRISDGLRGRSLPLRCAAGSAAITGVEFLVGCVCNLGLGMRVWDYSGEMFNLAGQVCARYSALWFLLSIPLIGIADRFVVSERKPSGLRALSPCAREKISI